MADTVVVPNTAHLTEQDYRRDFTVATVQLGDEGRPQDYFLKLNTPQLNRVKYLVGIELASYVPASRVAAYDGDYPFLIVDHPVYDDAEVVQPDSILRSASQEEYNEVANLAQQLSDLWYS